MTDTKKRPRDPNQLAKDVVDLATMDEEDRRKLEAERKRSGQTPGKRGSSSSRRSKE